MQIHFVARENGPERLVTEAEVHFEEGPLAGARLVGFCLWKSPEGEVYAAWKGLSLRGNAASEVTPQTTESTGGPEHDAPGLRGSSFASSRVPNGSTP